MQKDSSKKSLWLNVDIDLTKFLCVVFLCVWSNLWLMISRYRNNRHSTLTSSNCEHYMLTICKHIKYFLYLINKSKKISALLFLILGIRKRFLPCDQNLFSSNWVDLCYLKITNVFITWNTNCLNIILMVKDHWIQEC